MEFRIEARTRLGQKFCELAEQHAVEAGEHAADHDREGTFPAEVFAAMKESGFLRSTVPEEFGGVGLTSAHDVAAGLARLAYGDGSTAIAANMHLGFGLIAGRTLRAAREMGDEELAGRMTAYLSLLGSGAIGMANVTEPGTDIRHPLVEATKVEDGWSISGRKIFGTLSPVADIFFVPVRTQPVDGGYTAGFAIVFRGTAGQTVLENWDALGMRASGSNDVVYDDCVVPNEVVTIDQRWGDDNELGLLIATAGNEGLLGSFLGIAEAARDQVIAMATTRKKAPSGRRIAERHGIQHQVAEMEADLETCRALIERAGRLIDFHLFDRPPSEVTLEDLHQLNRTFQCAKLVANRVAIAVVDRALTISGGAGYMSNSPLSRLYRDVRAGPFMQPLSPNEAYEYIGKLTLGLPPVLDG
jgi:alkylation response protein AidB-like acyl-CoA dehydrogenase